MNASLSCHPLYEDLTLSLEQVEALMHVLTHANMCALKPSVLNNYFDITQEMVNKARLVCAKLSNVNYCENIM